MKYDFIIVGTGIAGLYSALNIPKEKKVLVISKSYPWESNSFYAQGGISVARDKDDIETHISDTLIAGANYCNKKAVEVMVTNSKKILDGLISQGLNFDKDNKGNLLYTKEGAHSNNRILHAGGDATGRYIHSFLLENLPHQVTTNYFVVDLLIKDNICYGLTLTDGKKFWNAYSNVTILATGGVGGLYKYNTNSNSISGEIQGLAFEKGISLKNMEMLQFHPTVFNGDDKPFLLTESLRGEGATIIDNDNKRFLFQYDKRGELASRDIVSRAIVDYTTKNQKDAFISFENFEKDWFLKRFPTVSNRLLNSGYQIPKDKIPIYPAYHYSIGGIETDLNGKVANMKNLFAIGEVASTGVHGANRLASNSLLEALVFAKIGTDKALLEFQNLATPSFPVKKYVLNLPNDKNIKDKLQIIMWQNVGIIRDEVGLKKAKTFIEEHLKLKTGRALNLQLLTSLIIVKSALENKKSIGVHYRK
jgi:L-aspartate oxidase